MQTRRALISFFVIAFVVTFTLPAMVNQTALASLNSLPANETTPQSAFAVSAAYGETNSQYHVQTDNSNSLSAYNPGQGLDLTFTPDALNIVKNESSVQFRLTGYGYTNAVQSLTTVQPQAELNRVTYDYGNLSAWYINGGLGLQQGFTIEVEPGHTHQPLRVEVAIDGNLQPVLQDQRINFLNDAGQSVLSYHGLLAFDAMGASLPASMILNGNRLALDVDITDAIFPITIDPWIQESNLTPPDATANMAFGFAVDVYEDTAVIGAPWETEAGIETEQSLLDLETNVGTGAVYIFSRNDGAWDFVQKLTPPNVTTGDEFGYAVAIDGDTLVVGAPYADGDEADQGMAWVFRLTDDTWELETELTSPNPAAMGSFGQAVALNGDQVLIGASLEDVESSDDGRAYYFARNETSWELASTLVASNSIEESQLGLAVDLDGNTAIIGAQGAAYIFDLSDCAETCNEVQQLVPDDAQSDNFGLSVGISNDTAVVGAPNAEASAVYIFSGENWDLKQTIDGDTAPYLGWSVSINTTTLVIGVPQLTEDSELGQVQVYAETDGDWQLAETLSASDGTVGDGFGWAVAFYHDTDTILVGAPQALGSAPTAYADSSSKRAQIALIPVGSAYAFVDSESETDDSETEAVDTSSENAGTTGGSSGGTSSGGGGGTTHTNSAPVANDDHVNTTEDASAIINVLANDTDADGDSLSVTQIVLGASDGTVSIDPDGNIIYTPNTNFNGVNSFVYEIGDGNGGTATATAYITVNSQNDAPIAADDSATTDEDNAVNIDVLANDTDLDSPSLSVSQIVSGPSNGGAVIEADNTVTYTPALNFNGSDSFVYEVSDGNGGTATATVTITVNPVNDPPTANNDSFSVDEDGFLSANVKDNDVDVENHAISLLAVDTSHGVLVLNHDGTFTYTPSVNFNGTDSFTYVLRDPDYPTTPQDAAVVTITVNPSNDNPTAVDDSATTNEDNSVNIDVLANDTDIDGDTLSVSSLLSSPAHGTVFVEADSTITYTPDVNFNGVDSFVYEMSDGNGGFDTATVTITINPVNDPPTANDDNATTNEDTSVNISVLPNDADVDGDTVIFSALMSSPGNGAAVVEADNTITYTPSLNFNGTDSFTYQIGDGNGGFDTATVTITVNPVNDPPIANNDSFSMTRNTVLSDNVKGNDTDIEGHAISLLAVDTSNGVLVLNHDGSFTYTPSTDFTGTDSFTYVLRDPDYPTTPQSVAVVTITVNP